jgi:hypothetical protein
LKSKTKKVDYNTDYLKAWLLLGEIEATAKINGKLIYTEGSLTEFENSRNKDGSISTGNRFVLDKLKKLNAGLSLFKTTSLPEWAHDAIRAAKTVDGHWKNYQGYE